MRRPLAAALVALLAVLLLVPACRRKGPAAAQQTDVIALLGDEPVEEPGFAAYVKAATGDELKAVSPQVASSLLDQYLEELLLDRAVAEAVPPAKGETPADRRADVIGRTAKLDALSDTDLRAEYDAHRDRYVKPPLVRLSQLVLPTKEKVEQARKKLREGVPWIDVSRQLSAAPNAATGGSLGLLASGEVPPLFEKAIRGVPEGGLSAPVETDHGYHLFRVEERAAEHTIPFEEARAGIRLTLAQERSAAAVKELVDQAAKKARPRVVEDHLPFAYVGTMARVGAGGKR